jgi:hypothetical protein
MITQPSLTVVGMMFSVLLGFFIAQSMRDFATANANIVNEANSVGEVFRDARGLPEVDRKRIRNLCRQYVDAVIQDEWTLLSGYQESDRAQEIMNDLWQAALSVNPTNDREKIIYQSFFKGMNELGGFRRIRTGTNTASLTPGLWIIIAMGAAAIVSLTFLFAPDSRAYHIGLLACLLVPLTLNIFLLSEYAHPFTGFIPVKPTMFESLKRKILIQDDSAPEYLTQPVGTAQ